jgi:CheY-like chemotaxis protein
VEDNPEEQFLIRKILEEYDFTINLVCIHDGEEFLDNVKRRINIAQIPSPDLILMDLNMPKLDGIATLRSIKQSKELRHIPVIILTGSVRWHDVINSYKNYASGYIRKSFEYDTLKKHIHLAINYWTECVILPTQLASRHLHKNDA